MNVHARRLQVLESIASLQTEGTPATARQVHIDLPHLTRKQVENDLAFLTHAQVIVPGKRGSYSRGYILAREYTQPSTRRDVLTFYSNTTTHRLEGRARTLGYDRPGIVISPNNSAGRFFLVAEDGSPKRNWTSLGWTRSEAAAYLAGLMAHRRDL